MDLSLQVLSNEFFRSWGTAQTVSSGAARPCPAYNERFFRLNYVPLPSEKAVVESFRRPQF